MALVVDECEQGGVLEIVGHAGGADHELAPELAAPETAVAERVVVAPLKRTARLAEDVVLRVA